MGHLYSGKESRFTKTPTAWLPIGRQINTLVNDWSGRSDIVTFIGEGAGHGHPACFVPAIAEMEVNVDAAFGEEVSPEYIGDLTQRSVQFDHTVAMGAVLHEAMHAKHSTLDLLVEINKEENEFKRNVATWLEESRIEKRGIQAFPENRAFLRACALRLVIGDLKDSEDYAGHGIKAFSQLMLLTLARVDAGVLDPEDVEIVQKAADQFFSAKTMRRLRSVWTRGQRHRNDSDGTVLLTLAQEWCDILADAGQDPADDKSGELPDWLTELLSEMMGSGEGDDGKDGEGSGSGRGILSDMADDVEIDAQSEANSQATKEAREAEAERRAKDASEAKTHRSAAAEVFGRGTGPGASRSYSELAEERSPNTDERRAAVALSKALDRARYRDRVSVKRSSVVPPGRLNARRALAASEQRARGAEVTAEVWSRKQRKHADDPNLTVGVLVDISGSMGMAMEPMASTAWILSEAARRVQGKCSMVYYGNDVFPTLSPGEHMKSVKVYTAPDGTEKFDKAFQALDGKLNLLTSTGARLLVVVSDLYYTGYEGERTTYWMQRCRNAGIAVVVVPFEYDAHASTVVAPIRGVEVVPNSLTSRDIVGAAQAIGDAAVRQLQVVSQ